jgi:hypothetical protein
MSDALTWTALVPAFVAVLENGTPEGRRMAREELIRMARAADLWNAHAPATDKEPTA